MTGFSFFFSLVCSYQANGRIPFEDPIHLPAPLLPWQRRDAEPACHHEEPSCDCALCEEVFPGDRRYQVWNAADGECIVVFRCDVEW